MDNLVHPDPVMQRITMEENEKIKVKKHLRMIEDMQRDEILALSPITEKIRERQDCLKRFFMYYRMNPKFLKNLL